MKKQYFAPKFKVVEINQADIICTSDVEVSAFSIVEGAGFTEEVW